MDRQSAHFLVASHLVTTVLVSDSHHPCLCNQELRLSRHLAVQHSIEAHAQEYLRFHTAHRIGCYLDRIIVLGGIRCEITYEDRLDYR